MKRVTIVMALVAMLALGGVLGGSSNIASAAGSSSTVSMNRFDEGALPSWATATLTRTNQGVTVDVHTTVAGEMFDIVTGPLGVDWVVGDATTLWWVVFNEPQFCDGGCGEDEVRFAIGASDSHPNGDDLAGTIALIFATGQVADSDDWQSQSTLAIGDNTGSILGTVLEKPMTAEIHAVLRSHGAADNLSAAELAAAISSLAGGCETNVCGDQQFAAFPPKPLADAQPTSRMVRFDGGALPSSSTATLTRMGSSVVSHIHTAVDGDLFDLVAGPVDNTWRVGDATTLWWVVFNHPEYCVGGCGEDEVQFAAGANPDHPNGAKLAGTIAVIFGMGQIADSAVWQSTSTLMVGDATGSLFGTVLEDASAAEIHLVIRSHGQSANLSADDLTAALTSFGGGCETNICGDSQAAVFLPSPADGPTPIAPDTGTGVTGTGNGNGVLLMIFAVIALSGALGALSLRSIRS